MTEADHHRVLVTGGGGFIGRTLLARLKAHWPLARFLVTTRGDGFIDVGPRISAAKVDLGQLDDISAVVESFRPTIVIHLAAQSSVQLAHTEQSIMWSGNFQTTYNLLSAIQTHCRDSLFVFSSSAECYGNTFTLEDFVTERSPLQPGNAYGRSKAASEYLIQDIHHGPSIVLRLFNQIGAGQDERFVTASFAAQLARIERRLVPPRISVGDLSAERDFCDVNDMVEALVGLLIGAHPLDRTSTFNICSGATRSIQSVLDILLTLTDADVAVEIDPARLRPSAIARAGGSNAAIRAATGWTPTTPITQTLENLLNHWRARSAQ